MKRTLLCLFFILIAIYAKPQQTEDDFLNDLLEPGPEYATSVFKASRIITGHSVKQPDKGDLEFRISHRFGKINNGVHELWGIDEANIHFSLELSPLDRLTLGTGRSNYNKTYDGYAKVALLKQQKGARKIPVSVSFFTSVEVVTNQNLAEVIELRHRLYYTNQLLIARKFNNAISLQLAPTIVHRNLVENAGFPNDVLALGVGGRVKVTNRVSVNAEGFFLSNTELFVDRKIYLPLSVGIDLETGGHVFQIMLTNGLPMREAAYITETTGRWGKGDLHLGFNVSRMFSLY